MMQYEIKNDEDLKTALEDALVYFEKKMKQLENPNLKPKMIVVNKNINLTQHNGIPIRHDRTMYSMDLFGLVF